MSESQKIALRCDDCGIAFMRYPSAVARSKRHHYCSRECKYVAQKGSVNPNWHGGPIPRVCEACGGSFTVAPQRVEYRAAKYCSRACRKKATQKYPDKRTKAREAKRRRRAIKKAGRQIRTHTLAEWLDLLERYKHQCAKCETKRNLTRDHIIPLSLGGHDGIENIQPLCGSCNSRKHNRREMLL